MVQLINGAEVIDLEGQDLEGRIIGYPRFERYLIVMQGQKLLGGEDLRDDIEHQAERLAGYYPPEASVFTATKQADGHLCVMAE